MKFLIMAACVALFTLQACNNGKTPTNESTKTDTMNNMNSNSDNANMKGMDNGLMSAMKPSMDQSEAMKMTGDFDYDFASMMIHHHQGAVDMAQVELSKGSDAQVKGWAQKIIDAQKAEISQFQQYTASNRSEMKNESAEQHNEIHEAHEKMDKEISGMAMTGKVDTDFVMMMKAHHQSAVAMAEDELSHGKKPEMKKMAQKIIDDQKKEINDFNEWLSKNM